ncbi:MAG: hypothetical protein HS122_15725 [Opitutaceae bacterium]|nr:hypothetical protein [Opitutaceae bacterium]
MPETAEISKRVSRGSSHRPLAGVFWFSAIVLLALLSLAFPPDGAQRSTLPQFIGRFHPLVVHFPIALLFLLPVIEVCALFRRGHALRGAPAFLLWIATATAILGTALGWLLARFGGYKGDLVIAHMWSGCALSLICLLALLLRRRWQIDGFWGFGILYAPVLMLAVGVMAFTAHQGGQLIYGDKYLTEYMPSALRSLLGLPVGAPFLKSAPGPSVPPGASDGAPVVEKADKEDISFYNARIEPALERTCRSCHGPKKTKGGLRLDTYALMLQGGDSGPAVVAGKLDDSELYRRITLPHDDEEFMPGGNKKPLTATETKWIELWIAAGASETAPLSSFSQAPSPPEEKQNEAVAWAPDYRPRLEVAKALAERLGIRVVARSQQPGDGLVVRTASAPAHCTDDAIAALAPLSDVIVEAELARTRVTDKGLASISTWKNLRHLDLTATAVTAEGLRPVAALDKLEILNVTDSQVDPAGLPPGLVRRDGLTIYGATPISEETAGSQPAPATH